MATSRFSPEVSALLDAHAHPLRTEIDQLRAIILSADPRIVEGVKWNTASFRISDWFATLNGPRHMQQPMMILHAGAKAKGMMLKDRIPDPEGLITWLGNERAQILLKDGNDIGNKSHALKLIVKRWIDEMQ